MACKKGGQWAQAVSLLDDLQALTPATPPSTRAYNGAAAACMRSGQHSRALTVLQGLADSGGTWDLASFSTAITAHGRQGQWRQSVELLRRLERDAEERSGREGPNDIVYGATIGACAAAAPPRWREAMALLKRMRARGVRPTVRSFNSVLTACARAGELGVALRLLDGMAPAGVSPDVFSYTAVLTGCAAATPPDVRTAEALLERMGAEGVKPSVVSYGAVAQAHANAGSWREAVLLLDAMERADPPVAPNAVVMCTLISACGNAGEWRVAIDLLHGMEARYGVAPDTECRNAAIHACARGRQWELALRELDALGDRATLKSYGATLAALSKCGRWEECLQLLRRMEDNGLRPSVPCYTAAISACGNAGEWAAAAGLWRELRARRELSADWLSLAATLDACYAAGEWRDDAADGGPSPSAERGPLAGARTSRVCELLDGLIRQEREQGQNRPIRVVIKVPRLAQQLKAGGREGERPASGSEKAS